jgi:hypothetical protein
MSAQVSTSQELEIEIALDSVRYPFLLWRFPQRTRPMVHIPESQEGQRWHSHKDQASRARTGHDSRARTSHKHRARTRHYGRAKAGNAGRARMGNTGRARARHTGTARMHHVSRARKGHHGTTSTGHKGTSRICHDDKARTGWQTWFNRGSVRDTSRMCHAPLQHRLRQATHNTLGLGSWSTVSYSVYSETDLPQSGPRLSATCRRAL